MNGTSAQWVQGLTNPECYPHPVNQIQLLETHISWVILTGSFAYKIKKPVKYSFVDFSTLYRRRWFCEEEVRVNRRLAPDVYLGVVPITGSPTSPEIEGSGIPFEFAVKMKQFSEKQDIHFLLADKEQSEKRISQLADANANFHSKIDKAGEGIPYGNPEVVWKPITECFDEIPSHLLFQDSQRILLTIKGWLQDAWFEVSETILQRKLAGFVRECHGDLHLGNISMFEGNVCVFDALEFEPGLRWIDVMSEISFLVMDLEKHGRPDLAYVFLNRYLEITGDYEGLRVFRLYKVYRALVRAKVAGVRLSQLAVGSQEEKITREELTDYIELAHRFIHDPAPALILMHGVSGTGKTTVSTEVLKTICAIRVRSDVERKRLFVEPVKPKKNDSEDVDLYDTNMTTLTYAHLRELAQTLIQAGFVVVVDATFLQHSQRESFARLASQLGCGFIIVDAFAPKAVLAERIERRAGKGHDASDATVDIMEWQQETKEPFTQEEELNVIRVDSTDLNSIDSLISKLKDKMKG